MLILIGAGLFSIDDMTVSGMKAIKNSDIVYLDAYTSIMPGFAEDVKRQTGKEVVQADRELVEESDDIIEHARTMDVSFVVVGDPLSATTHSDLILRAVEAGVSYRVIHNTSVMTAIGCCGLQLYSFSVTVSIPFFDESGGPESFLDKIIDNFSSGYHTLCLLDIKVKERTIENTIRNRKLYEPPRYMSCAQAAKQILHIIDRRKATTRAQSCLTKECLAIGMARIGSPDQSIVLTTLEELGRDCPEQNEAFKELSQIASALGGPLHSLIIPGRIHFMEQEFLTARYRFHVENTSSLPHIIHPSLDSASDKLSAMAQLFAAHNDLVSKAGLR